MPSALDRALELCPTDAARLELARVAAELQLGPESQEWIVMILYAEARRLFGAAEPILGKAEFDRLEKVAGVLETTTARITAPPARVVARRPSRLHLRLVAIILCIATMAWIGGALVATAHVRFVSAQVARLVTTPSGSAALRLLDANGVDFTTNLAHCTRFTVHGRAAMHCNLWREGPRAIKASPLSPISFALANLPAWPFAIVAVLALALASTVVATFSAPRVRMITVRPGPKRQ